MRGALASVFMDTIQSIREALGLTQAELAECLGIHQSTISRMERGELETDKRTMIAARTLLGTRKVRAA